MLEHGVQLNLIYFVFTISFNFASYWAYEFLKLILSYCILGSGVMYELHLFFHYNFWWLYFVI